MTINSGKKSRICSFQVKQTSVELHGGGLIESGTLNHESILCFVFPSHKWPVERVVDSALKREPLC